MRNSSASFKSLNICIRIYVSYPWEEHGNCQILNKIYSILSKDYELYPNPTEKNQGLTEPPKKDSYNSLLPGVAHCIVAFIDENTGPSSSQLQELEIARTNHRKCVIVAKTAFGNILSDSSGHTDVHFTWQNHIAWGIDDDAYSISDKVSV